MISKNIITVLFICSLAQGLNSGAENISSQASIPKISQNSSKNAFARWGALMLLATPTVVTVWNCLNIRSIKQDLAKNIASQNTKKSAELSLDESQDTVSEEWTEIKKLRADVEKVLALSEEQKKHADALFTLEKNFETLVVNLHEKQISYNADALFRSNLGKKVDALEKELQSVRKDMLTRNDFELIDRRSDKKQLFLKKS